MVRLMWVLILPVTVPLGALALAIDLLGVTLRRIGEWLSDDVAEVPQSVFRGVRLWAAQVAYGRVLEEKR